MQKIVSLDLPKENNFKFYYRNDFIQKSKDELEEFLDWDKSMDNLEFAKKMMYSQELKANNLIEGYGDDLELIKSVIKEKTGSIKDNETRQRILNLYYGYYYILHHRKIDEQHLHELYQILSNNLLSDYDKNNMGSLYREKEVYILQNGRLDSELSEGASYENIDKLLSYYFAYVNGPNELSKIDEYIKSQVMHFYFVYIHPYFDVNGRTSRTMAMWYLLKNQAYPYIIFNRGIIFKGSKYDKIIKCCIEKSDISYFLEMMLDTLKLELEKEHIMQDIASSCNYKLDYTNIQTLHYFLTMNGIKTIADFSKIYNRFNDKKKTKEIYREMIEPLIDMNILKVIRETKRKMGNIPNVELDLNKNLYEMDEVHLSRIKLK